MRRGDLIVLKFGGSALRDESALFGAVHEIYRWRRSGRRVVAVVSAIAGRTDALLSECGSLAKCDAAGHAVAAHVSGGELDCASRLGLLLERAGVPATTLGPGSLGLLADGPALDAHPVCVDVPTILRALERDGVVVTPGFVGIDREGRSVVFGRGGSDLTALFLARSIGASVCRLIKDVDGLYERDPAAPGPRPRRFASATWADALATDGSILQHKAVRYACEREFAFELGGLNATRPTVIGGAQTVFGDPDRASRPSVALLGLGTVGAGVHELLRADGGFEISAIAVRRADVERDPAVPAGLLTEDPVQAATSGASIVIEAMGGLEPAGRAVEAALRSGSHVITANKLLLAERGETLGALARRQGVTLACSASVGGSAPILELAASRPGVGVRSVRAVLNGATNFILTRLECDGLEGGDGLVKAISEARRLGFAEADPSRDLLGLDAADKLRVLARTLGLEPPPFEAIRTDPLTEHALEWIRSRRPDGTATRQVAEFVVDARGRARAEVRLRSVSIESPFGEAVNEQNVAVMEWNDGHVEIVRGRGAGQWPTAESVMADALEIRRTACDLEQRSPTTTHERRSIHV